MTLTQNFAAKLAVAFTAVAMMLSMVAPAQAQTVEELQAQIAELMATINSLSNADPMASASTVCPYTWTRSLSQGSTGSDVMMLQQFLNSSEDTRVAATGAGSAGMETQYYGPATAAAVSKFQVKYRADVLSPAGLVNPTGYFGPSSMAKANALCVTAPVDGGDMDGDTDGDTDGDSTPATLSGEASLEDFEIDDADDSDVEEGAEDAEIAEITIEFTEGDAEISRLDLAFTDEGGADSDAWDAFETISLWVDGDKIAEENADDDDDYLGDEDLGVIRFSDLDLVGMEDEEVVIVVAATLQNNVDTDVKGDWDVTGVSMRFFDADDVATTESGATITGQSATFTIQSEGTDDELDVKSNSDDPEATTLLLDDSSKETYEVFMFDLDSDEDSNDIEINEIVVDVASSTSGDIRDYVNDAELLVGGDALDAEDVTFGTSTITFEFDGGDFVIDGGDRVEITLELEFDALDPGEEGHTMSFTVDGAKVDAEGADDVTVGGSATSETHTVITEGIVVLADGVETDTDTQGDNDTIGTFTITFDVTAYEEDFYIATTGVNFSVEGGTATTTFTVTSTGDEDTNNVFTVEEGETEEFTLEVTVDPDATAQFRVTLDSVDYTTNANGVDGTVNRDLSPASDFRTSFQLIQGS